MSKLTRVKLF